MTSNGGKRLRKADVVMNVGHLQNFYANRIQFLVDAFLGLESLSNYKGLILSKTALHIP